VANPQTRTIPVELTPVITSMKGKNKFIPNTFAKAKFHITEKQVIARNTESNSADSKADIPLSALSKNGNEFQVAVADNGVAKLKPVTIEMQLKSSKVKIISGINVGDEIILNPTSIKNGSKITIK
jgi:hypothetical protein